MGGVSARRAQHSEKLGFFLLQLVIFLLIQTILHPTMLDSLMFHPKPTPQATRPEL